MTDAACILGLGTTKAAYQVNQDDYVKFLLRTLKITGSIAEKVTRLAQNSGIDTRNFVVNDSNIEDPEQWKVLPKTFPIDSPTTEVRNKVYVVESPRLAIQSCEAAIANWGGNAQSITHIISVSCTGVMAPGIETYLMKHFNMKNNTQRLGINLMGCFGAFRGLAIAKSIARENPKNRILLVCTELCSLHFQVAMSIETFIGNAIFGDGSAAVIVGSSSALQPNEKVYWEIETCGSTIVEHTPNLMTWEVGNTGFVMKLSVEIPKSLKTVAPEFVKEELKVDLEQCAWAIHPGGKAIIEGMEEVLHLDKNQTSASWNILRDYGNMSSATFLYVLDETRRLADQLTKGKNFTVGLGFGPGLALEGIVLRNGSHLYHSSNTTAVNSDSSNNTLSS